MIEHRKIERFRLSIPVRLVTASHARRKEVLELNTSNISARGAFFKADIMIPEGTTIHLDFVLPVAKLVELIGMYSFVKVHGKVVRSGNGGMAVTFDDDYEIMPFRNV